MVIQDQMDSDSCLSRQETQTSNCMDPSCSDANQSRSGEVDGDPWRLGFHVKDRLQII